MVELILFIGVIYIIYKIATAFDGKDSQIVNLTNSRNSLAEEKSTLQRRVEELKRENTKIRDQLQQEKRNHTQAEQTDQESHRTAEMEQLRQDVVQAKYGQQEAENRLAAAKEEIERYQELAKSLDRPRLKELIHQTADPKVDGIKQAKDQIAELYATTWYLARVDITPRAIRELEAFNNYKKPGELVRAVQAVLEAGAQYYERTLGTDFDNFFKARNFDFSNSPEPHLKVDEGKSLDQVLRIYWTTKGTNGRMKISWIGRHQ